MALILSIETSTKICSVALHKADNILSLQELYMEKSHSGLLSVLIKDIVSQAGYDLGDLNGIAVSKGPGSYTGLRIGTSTAKGMAFGLDIPLIGVNTLEAMAYGMKKFYDPETLLCPMIDARRMEVYCLLADNKMNLIEETQAKIIDEGSFNSQLKHNKIVFFGDGAPKCKTLFEENPNACFVNEVTPSAQYIGALAFAYYKEEKWEDLAYFDPFYLKEFRVTQPKKK